MHPFANMRHVRGLSCAKTCDHRFGMPTSKGRGGTSKGKGKPVTVALTVRRWKTIKGGGPEKIKPMKGAK